jgi:DNA-binding transcriptional regulator YiaG
MRGRMSTMNAKKIRKKLIDLELSQTELAKILGIGVNRVNDAIADRREGKKYQKLITDYLNNHLAQ